MKKLFAGIHQVKFDEKNEFILAMRSLEGEVVPLVNKVKINHQVEVIRIYLARFLFIILSFFDKIELAWRISKRNEEYFTKASGAMSSRRQKRIW